MRTVQFSSQTHQDDDSSMNLDVGELCLSELLTSDYFQGHDTDGIVGEPYLFNQEMMEDWSGGDCDQIGSFSIKQFLKKILGHLDLKKLLAPSTIGVIDGFVVGVIPRQDGPHW
ncbi:hypothetical protein AAC387_Pa03g3308 [Persea americana]